MGRWAQRRVRGGGYAPSPSCIVITDALVIDSDTLHMSFSLPVDAAESSGSDVHDDSTGGDSGSVSQVSANVLAFTDWNAGIGNGEHWTFTPTDPAICPGQTGTMHT